MPDRTLLDLYRHDADVEDERHIVHATPEGLRTMSSLAFLQGCAALADGLAGLGVAAGDRVVLLSDNRPEWHMVDLAVLALGAADVPVYPTLQSEQVAYQLRDSGARVAVGETREQVEKLLAARAGCPDLEHIVLMEGEPPEGVSSLSDILGGGGPESVERFWQRASAVGEDDLATIVYTSGTTGEPKGVMLTHRNFVSNVDALLPVLELTPHDLVLEFLPLCHVFERCAGYLFMRWGVRRAYCATANVGGLIAAIRPTLFCSVPRVMEKIYESVQTKAAAAPPLRRRLLGWGVEVGRKRATRRLAQRPVGLVLALEHAVADRLVLSKVRAALGGRVRTTITGAAPLPRYANEFFQAIGIWVQEGYGLTETSPVVSANGPRPEACRLGTVGRPLHNVEVKLDDDGELLVRGPSVFTAYWHKPEATAEAFTADGFFRTGDIASIDSDGFISIVDRKKDLIVTAGGKNVAPQPTESRLVRSPFVESAVLIGDRRPFIVALLVPARDALLRWASQRGLSGDLDELVLNPGVQELYGGVVEDVNRELARFEQIKRFAVIPTELSIARGQLTPTMKVKRRVVEREFSDVVERLYEAAPQGMPGAS